MGAKMPNPCPYPRDFTSKPNASPAPPPPPPANYVTATSSRLVTPMEQPWNRVEIIEKTLVDIRDELQKIQRGE
jgi:hypothetical protein